mmetsp:Transcript_29452/g.21905  ORF Transcript_29452/g.21905 Transcript_29452/m.21905 type:complete len:126 (+) Transcript_29452:102-479(+)
MQKTLKQANWNMDNDSDLQEEFTDSDSNDQFVPFKPEKKGQAKKVSISPFNQQYDEERLRLLSSELEQNMIRFRMLAHSLTEFKPIKKNVYLERKRNQISEKEAENLTCNCVRSTGKRTQKSLAY